MSCARFKEEMTFVVVTFTQKNKRVLVKFIFLLLSSIPRIRKRRESRENNRMEMFSSSQSLVLLALFIAILSSISVVDAQNEEQGGEGDLPIPDEPVKADDERGQWPAGVTKVSLVHFDGHDAMGECGGGELRGSQNFAHGHCLNGNRWSCRENRWCFSRYNTCEKPSSGEGRHKHTEVCGVCANRGKLVDCDTSKPKFLQCEDDQCTEKCELVEGPKPGCDSESNERFEFHKCQVAVEEQFADLDCDPFTRLSRNEHAAGPGTCMNAAQYQCVKDAKFGPKEAEAESQKAHEEHMKHYKGLSESEQDALRKGDFKLVDGEVSGSVEEAKKGETDDY